MNTIPPAIFTIIIVGGFFLAAGILAAAEGVKAVKAKIQSNRRYREYEQSRRRRIRELRRERFRQDAEDMETAYKAMVDYKAEKALEQTRCIK